MVLSCLTYAQAYRCVTLTIEGINREGHFWWCFRSYMTLPLLMGTFWTRKQVFSHYGLSNLSLHGFRQKMHHLLVEFEVLAYDEVDGNHVKLYYVTIRENWTTKMCVVVYVCCLLQISNTIYLKKKNHKCKEEISLPSSTNL